MIARLARLLRLCHAAGSEQRTVWNTGALALHSLTRVIALGMGVRMNEPGESPQTENINSTAIQ